jgi:hypothetical protein
MKKYRENGKIKFQGSTSTEIIELLKEKAKAEDRSVSSQLIKIVRDHYKKSAS